MNKDGDSKKAQRLDMMFHSPKAVDPFDVSEVALIKRYALKSSGASVKVAKKSTMPLIDNIKPQPKAFFAYLQMPEVSKTKLSKRVRRKRKGSTK